MAKLVFLILLLWFPLAHEHAYARAGSGESFSSDSDSSSGSSYSSSSSGSSYDSSHSNSSSSSSGGEASPLETAIGILVIAVGAFLFIKEWVSSLNGKIAGLVRWIKSLVQTLQGKSPSQTARLALTQRRRRHVQAIRAHDPQFDETKTLGRFSQAFKLIQVAWSNGDMAPTRHFISDAVFERFTLQLTELAEQGLKNTLSKVKVYSANVVHLETVGGFEALTVAIAAKGKDRTTKIGKGVIKRSSARFTEHWTFLRKRGLASASKPGLIEGCCPACAATMELNQHAQCSHCGVAVRSGSFDWILSEITQEAQNIGNRKHIKGSNLVTANDPHFSPQLVEDRASVAFWRWITARRRNNSQILTKVSTPEMLESFRQKSGVAWPAAFEVGVGSVELERILKTPDGKSFIALTTIVWTGTWRGGKPTGLQQSVFVMRRATTAKSPATRDRDAAHCKNCCAAIGFGPEVNCDHCGSALNDTDMDWQLVDVAKSCAEAVKRWEGAEELAA